jgi:putative tricarboxylic transport membrane protein
MFGVDITFVLIGLVCGVLAGMLPGVGMTVLMIASYPILYTCESMQVIQFYLSAILVSQFMGSVVATYFAIPGEPSSIPATIEGHKLARQGRATQAIFLAAGGSFVGGIIAFIFLYVLGLYLIEIFKMFTVGFNVVIITLVVVMIFLTPSKNIYERFGFPLLGSGLSLIGMSPFDSNTPWSFGVQALEVGIPDMALLLGLYTLPLLWHLNKSSLKERMAIERFNIKQIVFKVKQLAMSVFYAVYGFIVGFIPGIELGVVSNTAYEIQKKVDKKFKLKDPSENQLLAAETSNNSGAFAVILPLLIFGIPTTTSQAILYNILIDQSYGFGPVYFTPAMINSILSVIVFTSFAGFILSGPMARVLALAFSKTQKWIYMILSVAMLIITMYVGYLSIDTWLYFWTILLSFIFGMMFYGWNILKIIYFFIVTPFFVENWGRLAFILDWI